MRPVAGRLCTTQVTLLRADVTGVSEAAAAMFVARRTCAPLGGLVHAAGVQVRKFLSIQSLEPRPGTRKVCMCALHIGIQ